MKIFYGSTGTPLGTVFVAVSQKGVVRIGISGPEPFFEWFRRRFPGAELVCAPERVEEPVRQLQEYFLRQRREFDLPLDLRGTPFQLKVWHALRQVPYGQTISYGELAALAGVPRAYRAVGRANHDNPLPIVIPCHRVIGKNGALVGYGGGLALKEKLLRLEGAI